MQKCIVCSAQMKRMFPYRGYEYYKCGVCGQVSTLPFPTKQQMRTYYEKKFKTGNYKLLRVYAKQYTKIYATFVSELKLHIRNLRGKSVLDVGCFTGEFLELMQGQGCSVYGLELQKAAVKIANTKLPGKVLAADVMGDVFPHKKFDIVTLFGIIEHVTDPIKLIRRSFQLLKPDGIVMVQTPNSGSLLARLSRKYWPPFAPVEHIHLFTAESLQRVIEQEGGKMLTIRGHWKKLPIWYVYNQFRNFGPEYYKIFKPFESFIKIFGEVSLPFYSGEMIAVARKK